MTIAAALDRTAGNIVGGGVVVALLGLAAGYGATPLAGSLALYLLLVAIMLVSGIRPPAAGFGAANRATLLRGVLVCAIGGLIWHGPLSAGWTWLAVAVALAAAALDGVDGWLARRHGGSAFGARFDMETDALFVLILAVLVWRFDKTGAWVLAAGAMRYAFGAAGFVWPALMRPLAPSRRRQAVCVLQTLALIACLAPIVTPAGATLMAGAALAILAGSFMTDVLRLAGAGRTEVEYES